MGFHVFRVLVRKSVSPPGKFQNTLTPRLLCTRRARPQLTTAATVGRPNGPWNRHQYLHGSSAPQRDFSVQKSYCQRNDCVTQASLHSDLGRGRELGSDDDLKYSDVNVLGTSISMAYCDIGPKDGPVVVLMHGSPSTYRVFKDLFQPLTANGVRMIMPNLPGMGLTDVDQKGVFNFSSSHKAELIKELIRTIGINRVETIVGFSMAAHMVIRICADENFDCIKSMTLLSGIGGRVHKLVRPFPLIKVVGNVFYWSKKIPILGSLITKLSVHLFNRLNLRGKTPESNIYSAYEASQLDFPQCSRDLLSISKRNLPVLMFHSDDDPFIEREIVHETMDVLGITQDDVISFDKNGEFTSCTKTFKDVALKRVVWFEDGGHRLQSFWKDIISGHMVSMVSAVKKNIV